MMRLLQLLKRSLGKNIATKWPLLIRHNG